MAQRSLSPAAFAEIAAASAAPSSASHSARMMVDTTASGFDHDLLAEPVCAHSGGSHGGQKRYHPEGELACVRGAAAAKTAMVVSSGQLRAQGDRRPAARHTPSGIRSTPKRMRPPSAPYREAVPSGARRCASPSAARIGAPSTACGRASASRLCSRAS